ncbi:DMT family transporter [Pseudomonas guariconensis]|uniref:DMT family transporter n=1 Tax=Pseudomonas TaxID=286 RepID=UPI001CE462AB|nr:MULTISPECIES: DMT family transporter [Pseudomonas]MCO7640210.1 DMT family transporter [Pseudomonas sp. S 311-6]MCO7515941.1 DMT family transporter [Pseudomonas putida]MCO7565598.1 DMT family transporter [Pseudomonas mosselii]MCO7593257.1 DMT family transporter [Pseudomonas guariconensis]MCO7608436.1 DMT family transporter [Pseudomonas guariconensis]
MIATSVSTAGTSTGHRNALLAAHIAAVLFGLTGILGALIQADASLITFGRATFAFIALGFVAGLKGTRLLDALSWRNLPVIGLTGTLLAAHWVTFFIAIKVGGVAVATLGFASFPAFIALIDLLVFRERTGATESLLLLLVTAGLVLVVPSFDLLDQGTMGLLWGLASGLAFALLAVANRRRPSGMDAMQVAFWQNVVVAALVAPFAFSHLAGTSLHGNDWVNLALLGVFCTGLSQFLFVKSLDGLQARTAGMVIALEPVYAIACAWWLFGEQPSLRMAAGAALIVLATLMTAWRKAAAH